MYVTLSEKVLVNPLISKNYMDSSLQSGDAYMYASERRVTIGSG